MKLKVTSGAFGENGMGEDGCGGWSWRKRFCARRAVRHQNRSINYLPPRIAIMHSIHPQPQPSFTLHSDIVLFHYRARSKTNNNLCICRHH